MADFFKGRTFVVLMIVIVCLGTVSALSASGQRTVFFTKLSGTLVTPVQNAFVSLGEGLSSVGDYFENHDSLRRENNELKETILTLEENLLNFERYREENERLQKLVELKDELGQSLDTEAAKVVAKETRNFSTVFVLNKGTLAGLEINDAVITRGGLVGYILEVGPNFSKVATLFEVEAAVGAICIRTADSGVLEGDLLIQADGYCKMSYISKEATIVVGDHIETSGYGGIYPPGILIGVVEEIAIEDHGLSRYAKILPSADLKNPKEVLVIKSFAAKEETK